MCTNEVLKSEFNRLETKVDSALKSITSDNALTTGEVIKLRDTVLEGHAKFKQHLVDEKSYRESEARRPIIIFSLWQKLCLAGAACTMIAASISGAMMIASTQTSVRHIGTAIAGHVNRDMGEHAVNAENIHNLDKRVYILEGGE